MLACRDNVGVGVFDALFQGAIDAHHMVGEHLVAVKTGDEAAAGGDSQIDHTDLPGELLFGDKGCLRSTGGLVIICQPLVAEAVRFFAAKFRMALS